MGLYSKIKDAVFVLSVRNHSPWLVKNYVGRVDEVKKEATVRKAARAYIRGEMGSEEFHYIVYNH